MLPRTRRKSQQLLIALVFILGIGLVIRTLPQGDVSADQFPSEGQVAEVIDGDTILLLSGEKIRYLGINAPEVRVRRGRRWVYRPQPFGKEATEYNRDLVSGKWISLEYDHKKKDNYGRLLAYVTVGDLFVNGEIVRRGLALVDVRRPNYRYQSNLLALQEEARAQCQGMWGAFSDCRIEADDAYRHIDEVGMVQGDITGVRFSRSRLMLSFGQQTRKGFTAIIYREHLKHFCCPTESILDFFRHKRANVYGFIKDLNGPAIVLCAPTQLDILEDP